MGARDSGWIQLYSENVQEAYDNVIQGLRMAEDPEVHLPVMVCMDGFILSHTVEPLELLPDREVRSFVGAYEPEHSLLDVDDPWTFGPLALPDAYYEFKAQQMDAMDRALEAVPRVGTSFGEMSGRSYGLLEPYRCLEALVRKKDFEQMCRVAERVCGICSAIHGMTYCRALEALLGVTPPDRAEHLRVAWSELHRMHSHLLWLGLLAEAMGFESLFMQLWRVREEIMDLLELTAGNRVIISVNRIGGVRRDVTDRQAGEVHRVLAQVERQVRDLEGALLEDRAVRERLQGRGTLSTG